MICVSLSDAQLISSTAAARGLPYAARDAFLQAIVAELITDADIARAIKVALALVHEHSDAA